MRASSDLPQPGHQTADPFRDRLLLQRAVRDAEIASVTHAEGGSWDDRDFVLANQAFRERERREIGVDFDETVERAVRGRDRGRARSDLVKTTQ